MNRKRTILMYGRSRSGKSTLIGELAESLYKETGKPTLVYSIDKGGVGPLYPYIELGIVEVISQDDSEPWIFLNNACKGKVRKEGKWVTGTPESYAMIAFESMTGFADALMADLAVKSANGVNIGGSGNINFVVQGDGETLKVGGSNMGHYNVVQTRILDELWKSQKLNVPYIVWTASASRDDDQTAGGKVIGPAVVGKALTAEIPRHFDLTFRLDCLPAAAGKPEQHILYLGNSVDVAAGNAVGLGNTRVPLGAELPTSINPASLVKALKAIEQAETKVMEDIKKRLSNTKIEVRA